MGKNPVSQSLERRKTTPWRKQVGDKKVNISFVSKAQSRKAIIVLLRRWYNLMFPTKHISPRSVCTSQVLPMNTHETQISPFNPWWVCHPTLSSCIMIRCYCWMDAALFNCFFLSDLFALLIFNYLFPSLFLPPKRPQVWENVFHFLRLHVLL